MSPPEGVTDKGGCPYESVTELLAPKGLLGPNRAVSAQFPLRERPFAPSQCGYQGGGAQVAEGKLPYSTSGWSPGWKAGLPPLTLPLVSFNMGCAAMPRGLSDGDLTAGNGRLLCFPGAVFGVCGSHAAGDLMGRSRPVGLPSMEIPGAGHLAHGQHHLSAPGPKCCSTHCGPPGRPPQGRQVGSGIVWFDCFPTW